MEASETTGEPDDELEAMRAEIDDIDLAVLDLVSKRFEVTNRVGHYKVAHGIAASDPQREATQIARAREMAAAAGVNPDLAENVLRLVIDEVVRRHHEIAREVRDDGTTRSDA